ncbi:hypothetical protein HGRIS_006492 [Hohenbuehelia grisea]|uniref:Proteophosphoglycan ppg4 n=1 Tax=Hohenbuehelia grisea TaxID=104357 RepID=A0ABR3K2K6_9AGAR
MPMYVNLIPRQTPTPSTPDGPTATTPAGTQTPNPTAASTGNSVGASPESLAQASITAQQQQPSPSDAASPTTSPPGSVSTPSSVSQPPSSVSDDFQSSSSSSSSESTSSSTESSSSSSSSSTESSTSSSTESSTSSTESSTTASSTSSESVSSTSTREQPSTTFSTTPTPSSLGAMSTSFSTTEIVTYVGDQPVTITSVTAFPTSLYDSPKGQNNARTAIIAGSTTAAAVVLLLLGLAAVFLYRRHQRKRFGFIEALVSRHKQATGRARLLAGEDLDDEDGVPMTRYRDFDPHSRDASVASAASRATFSTSATPLPSHPMSPAPSLFHSRASESGSIFHEGGIWPPPAELVDPFARSIGAGEGLGIAGGSASSINRLTPSTDVAGSAVMSAGAGAAALSATSASDERISSTPNDPADSRRASVLRLANPGPGDSLDELVRHPDTSQTHQNVSGAAASHSRGGSAGSSGSGQYTALLSALDGVPSTPPPSYVPTTSSPLTQSAAVAFASPPTHIASSEPAPSLSVYSRSSTYSESPTSPAFAGNVASTSPTPSSRPLSLSGLPPGAAAPRNPQALARADQNADFIDLGDGRDNVLPANFLERKVRR